MTTNVLTIPTQSTRVHESLLTAFVAKYIWIKPLVNDEILEGLQGDKAATEQTYSHIAEVASLCVEGAKKDLETLNAKFDEAIAKYQPAA